MRWFAFLLLSILASAPASAEEDGGRLFTPFVSSKATGTVSSIIPAILSKKLNGVPVMMRISREEEHGIGGARPALHGRLKVGFSKEGRILALDAPGLNDRFRCPKRTNDRQLVMDARAVAERAAPIAATLAAQGLPASVLTERLVRPLIERHADDRA